MTGITEDVVAQIARLHPRRLCQESPHRRPQDRQPIRCDLCVDDPYPESPAARGPDPILDGVVRAYGGAFAAYARDELGFKTDMTYTLLASDISGKWQWREESSRSQPSVADDLRALLALTPSFHLMVAHGYSDMVTPYAVSRYVLDHLPPSDGEERTQLKLYRGGHMFYLDPDRAKPSPPTRAPCTRRHDRRCASHGERTGLDQFIPIRKSDILSALLEHGAFDGDEERKKFRRLCRHAGGDLSLRLFPDARAAAQRLLLFQSRGRAACCARPRIARALLRRPRAIARAGARGSQFHRIAARRNQRRPPAPRRAPGRGPGAAPRFSRRPPVAARPAYRAIRGRRLVRPAPAQGRSRSLR